MHRRLHVLTTMGSNDNPKGKEKITTDPRFAGIHNDPKFKPTKSKNFKIKLDDRFSKKDLEVRRKAKVDKYGRKLPAEDKEAIDFDRYFEKEKDDKTKSASDSDEEDDIQSPETKEETDAEKKLIDRARGETPVDYVSSSDEESSSESEEDSEDSDYESEEIELESSKPDSGDATKTLAVVNLDWDHVKSTDLFVTFQSFVPKGGAIKRIAIYPSEFGKERMQREEIEGPPKELFQSKKSKSSDKEDKYDIKSIYEEGDAEKDFDSKSLRRYQLERLRYYYAVVYCSDVSTAESIYQNCDGTEFESTANVFDLRYVPEGMEMTDEPRDECTSVPKHYKPIQFSTDALQHSKVKLTWDETPADRVEISKRAFTQKEIEEMDFKAYLASDSDESEVEHDDQAKNKLKALVMDSVKLGDKSIFDGKDDKEDDEVDMEITFTPGLDEQNHQTSDNDLEKEESTIDKIKRKEKERRKKRKQRVKELKKESEVKLKETLKKKNDDLDSADNDKKKAELELLMLDENEAESNINTKAHFNMKEILKSEKEKAKKSKYQNKDKIVEDEFTPDINDPRFKEVFEDHEFAIDPSQPEFKKTPAMEKILKERSKRSNKKTKNNKRKSDAIVDSGSSDKTKINSLVSKLKSKSKKQKQNR